MHTDVYTPIIHPGLNAHRHIHSKKKAKLSFFPSSLFFLSSDKWLLLWIKILAHFIDYSIGSL